MTDLVEKSVTLPPVADEKATVLSQRRKAGDLLERS